jgi:hypothetical protein
MTPSGMRGVLNDAVSIYFLHATLANAFVARWGAGYKVETADGVFRVRDDEPAARTAASLHRTLVFSGALHKLFRFTDESAREGKNAPWLSAALFGEAAQLEDRDSFGHFHPGLAKPGGDVGPGIGAGGMPIGGGYRRRALYAGKQAEDFVRRTRRGPTARRSGSSKPAYTECCRSRVWSTAYCRRCSGSTVRSGSMIAGSGSDRTSSRISGNGCRSGP